MLNHILPWHPKPAKRVRGIIEPLDRSTPTPLQDAIGNSAGVLTGMGMIACDEVNRAMRHCRIKSIFPKVSLP